jgi:hypothetical protein
MPTNGKRKAPWSGVAAITIKVARSGGLVTDLLIGEPLQQRLRVPKKHQAAVTELIDHPKIKTRTLRIDRYLRYYLVVHPGMWKLAIADARTILDGTYPWEEYGFSVDDEGNLEGPEGLIVDYDYNLLDPRGEPTLDPKACAEIWWDEEAFDGAVPGQRRRDLDVVVTVLGRSNNSLLQELKGADIGWNLTEVRPKRRQPHLELRHETFSGRAVLTEPEPGVLVCRILATDKYDPERLLALVMGALHRHLQQKVHSMTVQYVRETTALATVPSRSPMPRSRRTKNT